MAGKGQAVRLIALAIATGTLVSVGAGTASAAPAASTTRNQMLASGEGFALKVTINVPSVLQSALGSTIVQTISLTSGEISTVTTPLATSTAILGSGTTPIVSALLNKSTLASLTGRQSDASSALDINQAGLKVQVLPLTSKVLTPTGDGVLAVSNSAVAHVSIGGLTGALPLALAPVSTVLAGALGTQNGAVGQVAGTVGNTLVGAIAKLDNATGTSPAQTAAITDAITSLTGTLNGLTGTMANLAAATDIVSLDAVTSNQTISRSGDAVTSAVSNSVHNLNILNGLVKIDAITATATATAGGVAGSAKAVTQAPVLKVSIAKDALTALLDQNGLSLGGTVGSALPPALQNTVTTALGAASGLINQLAGVNVVIGKGNTSTAADGTAAAAQVAATTVTVNPPALIAAGLTTAAKPLVLIELVGAKASAASRIIPLSSIPATPVSLTSLTTTPGTSPLPRTGAELPAAGFLATLLMGGAMVVRRRRSSLS